MTILKQGKIEVKYYYGKCLKCGTIFQAEEKETYYTNIVPISNKVADCPHCKAVMVEVKPYEQAKQMLDDNEIIIGLYSDFSNTSTPTAEEYMEGVAYNDNALKSCLSFSIPSTPNIMEEYLKGKHTLENLIEQNYHGQLPYKYEPTLTELYELLNKYMRDECTAKELEYLEWNYSPKQLETIYGTSADFDQHK